MNSNLSEKALRNLTALVDFSALINSKLDIEFTLNNFLLTCLTKFHASKALIVLKNQLGPLYPAAYKGKIKIDELDFDSLQIKNGGEEEGVKNFMSKNGFDMFASIKSSIKTRGFVFIGERVSKEKFTGEDKSFLETLTNIAAIAVENSVIINELKETNVSLDSKVSQLTSLFELSKEYGSLIDAGRINKLLVYSLIGQLFVSKYAVVIADKKRLNIIESKYSRKELEEALRAVDIKKIEKPVRKSYIKKEFPTLDALGVELAVPLKIQDLVKGAIFLGKRINEKEYSESDVEYVYAVGSLAIASLENERLFKEEIEKKKLEEDLQIAKEIQKNLFPHALPKLRNFEIAALNIPSKQVGGDYYDAICLTESKCLIAIADVSGKGVPASLLMANLQAFIKAICKHGVSSLDEATNLINDLVSENTNMGNFITFFWGLIDDEAKTFTYVNAGHNPPLLIRGGEVIKLKKGGILLGLMKTQMPYLSETIKLQKGDAIILYTDGITEAMNKEQIEFTEDRLIELSIKINEDSAQNMVETIVEKVREFACGAEQSDDVTLAAIKAV